MTKPADDLSAMEHRSGFVALCGRPNVGKSTLLNALVGESIALATALPQTTRERFLGVWSKPAFQVVLVDTPGIHDARSVLNRFMVDEALAGARDVDVVLLLAEAPRLRTLDEAERWQPGPGALTALQRLATIDVPIVLVLTKIDLVQDARWQLPLIAAWQHRHAFAAIVPVSARTGHGLDELERVIVQRLPVGPKYFDDDQLSDRNMRWHAAELVRGELFERLGDEVPYSCAVTVEAWQALADRDVVRATIHVERDSQKGIVIGQGASMVRSISMAARQRIAELTGRPCELFLQVSVDKDWTKDAQKLARLGYREQPGRRR